MREVRTAGVICGLAVVGLVCGCGSGGGSSTNSPTARGSATTSGSQRPEVNPAGDIPDNQVYVAYRDPAGLFSVKVPEGWSRSTAQIPPGSAPATLFTDKLNTVTIQVVQAAAAPTPASATASEIPAIKTAANGFSLSKVTTVRRPAGQAVLITYRAVSPADPVTGKQVPDAVERYEFWRSGHEVVLALSGPQGADNVDPWRTITDSLAWSR